jgi:hypothetical protein
LNRSGQRHPGKWTMPPFILVFKPCASDLSLFYPTVFYAFPTTDFLSLLKECVGAVSLSGLMFDQYENLRAFPEKTLRGDSGYRFHNPTVKMPTRMRQDGHRDREPDEQNQETGRQDRRDDQSPYCHVERIRQHGPNGSLNRHQGPYIAV